MTIIKLHSTSSTNDYLKELVKNKLVENYTVVTAQNQENGRGQMGATWHTEEGKNLIMSIFVKDILSSTEAIFDLNVATSVAVFEALYELNVPSVAIKWANDIMAENKKICGILIENTIKAVGSIESVIGIGLNVNQTCFKNLPNATSIANVTNNFYDINLILNSIVQKLENNCNLIKHQKTDLLWQKFHQHLFKINQSIAFEDSYGTRFMGTIIGVNRLGKLEVQVQDNLIKTFAVKEIQQLF